MTATLLLVLLNVTDAGACEAMVQQRGDQAMGFSHARTTHHFALSREGGTIAAEAKDPNDMASLEAIRSHMRHIAAAFSAGNFEMPMFIHDRTPPGVPAMKRLKAEIEYVAEETGRGALVRVRTRNPEALEALHQFLKFQIADHATGDSVAVH